MYVTLCAHLDVCYAIWIINRYQSNPRPEHWTVVKYILKYLRRTKEYMLVYSAPDLMLIGYTNSNFQIDRDSYKSTSGPVFTLGGGVFVQRSIKQSYIIDSTIETEYVTAYEVAKEAIQMKKFLLSLEVAPFASKGITNRGVVANVKEPKNHHRGKHIE